MRTSNLVGFNPSREMPKAYDSGTGNYGGDATAAIGTAAPATPAAGGPDLKDPTKAHGVIGEDCVASLLVDTAATVNVYFFNKKWGRWVKGGADAASYSKAIEAYGQWAFYGQEGTLFYLVASAPVLNALLHCRPATQG